MLNTVLYCDRININIEIEFFFYVYISVQPFTMLTISLNSLLFILHGILVVYIKSCKWLQIAQSCMFCEYMESTK